MAGPPITGGRRGNALKIGHVFKTLAIIASGNEGKRIARILFYSNRHEIERGNFSFRLSAK